MAYNPGVSDISGQLRAQGMTRGMNSLLEGFDVGIKTYQQNKHIADTSIAKFGAVVANSDALKALLTDENERSKLPSDVVKAYLKLQKEGSLGVREASLLGGFADSYTKTEEDRQQREFRAAQMAQMKQQSAIAQQASNIAQAQNARDQAAANRIEGQSARNLKAVQDLQSIVNTADTLGAGYPIDFPALPIDGPASVGTSKNIPLPSLQASNSPLRSGITTPTPNVNILEEYRNKRDYVPVAGNMGGAGVLTVQAADRIKRRAADLEGTSLEQMIRAGITPTDEMMANSVLKDSANQVVAARATAAAENQRVKNELQALMLEIKEAKFNQDPTPIIASIQRAITAKIITQDAGNKYMSDVFIKAGTPPDSLGAQVAGAVRTVMEDKGTGTGTGTGTPELVTEGVPQPPIPRVGSSPEELQKIPRNSEFRSLDGTLRYKDEKGRLHLGGRPTK